ncbi:uncharacterized protein AMSG_01441 [Thecamonas trahens ATCC 50062]|uniref:Uncharacterized protein n=1 Tax=Thecamonas trahens ATCC 50062 TaxID=461836 RepID=A0A0L0DQN6_THETB|nr:hypothetical protein AMSG_01441 [Thecamonas trahens ATCC 50062]KNC54585.1 hypothetical protein AMSG_01441 [Thecamonas trahens ATCC 50062]|eukprot:XP_013761494.1 hypothetical protein AMSG_01441 [Thecamonas trahens ATCC 50062]
MAEAAADQLRQQVSELVKLSRAGSVKRLRSRLEALSHEAPEVVNARCDPGGWTCLHTAAYQGNKGCVRLLLEHGAKSTIRTHAGYLAIDYARRKGHAEIEEILYDALQREVELENERRRLAAASTRVSTGS